MPLRTNNENNTFSRRNFLLGKSGYGSKKIAIIAVNCLALNKTECRACEDACTARAIRFKPQFGGQYTPEVDLATCTSCADCLPVCPVNAISIGYPTDKLKASGENE